MRTNTLRQTIDTGQTAINAWLSASSGYAAEVFSHAGFDSVTVDAQHGMFGRAAVVAMLQAVSAGPATPMVRPSSTNAAEIGWLLDAGAYGVIAPSVDTAEIARDFVAACYYPPVGRRSFGASRGLLYGGPDYVTEAASVIMPWAMIESRSAADQLEEIIATPGLYGVYLGPNDLALDLGVTPGTGIGAEVGAVAHRMVEIGARYGVRTGLFCADGAEARVWADAGFDMVTPGNDMSYLRAGAAARIEAIRGPATAPDVAPGSGY